MTSPRRSGVATPAVVCRVCAACRSVLEEGTGEHFVFRRLVSRKDTALWFCASCVARDRDRCVGCARLPPLSRIPLCSACLFAYEEDSRMTE